MFSGNSLPEGSEAIAQAYAGHQFGHFTMLGDGRAVLMGEHISKNNERFDIQFKGSGKTPFSRNGDGRAALGPMLREYIISEAMHALNIPTTRSLAVVKTGEDVIRENTLQGAILTRVASSHLRVGTFQFIATRKKENELKTLINYTLNRHYPNIKQSKNQALDLLKVLIEQQTNLVVNWMRVGFIHGVMNTDNMAISGETIDLIKIGLPHKRIPLHPGADGTLFSKIPRSEFPSTYTIQKTFNNSSEKLTFQINRPYAPEYSPLCQNFLQQSQPKRGQKREGEKTPLQFWMFFLIAPILPFEILTRRWR
mgnify:CR=1 FL=1